MGKLVVGGFKKGKSAQALPNAIRPINSSNPKILRILDARVHLQKEKRAHRKFIWKTIADACTLGNELKKDEEAWREFCALDWGKLKGPKVHQHDQAIRFAMKFIFAKGKKGEKRASFYYNAVVGLVEKGLHGKYLVKAIEKAGGLRKLQSQKPTKNKAPTKPLGVYDDNAIANPVDERPAGDNSNHDLSEDEDDDLSNRFRELVHEGEGHDNDEDTGWHKPADSSVDMPFNLIFPKRPSDLTSAKLPVRVIIKGHVVSFGKSSIFKVDRHKVKKPTI
ncbi:hypothetical protein ELH75_01280 [Rhizobium leguminosarum]|uniref:hypothetical protein n=1 Tax=Rhizobium leguminosarum TaxID=384 RepID=UPI00102F9804|nr:hypothetical protein [Rhizobium leguminosarum]TAX99817.1 hypothetical protein ELH95_01065 [Rhizobium leguminosarum]TAZ59962.1 hypothetical protein ELH75_01280 [Rhizobium leguminosarum]